MEPTDRDRIVRILEERWKSPRICPLCRGRSFVCGHIEELRGYAGGTLAGGTVVEPVVSVSCKGCGYVLLFNACVLGLVDERSGKLKLPAKPEATC